MVKLFFFRGSRVLFMLAVLACIAVFAVFYTSPDIRPFSNYLESKIKKELQAEQCSISNLKLAWDSGPVIDFGRITLAKKDLVLRDVSVQLSFSFFRMLRDGFAPQLRLSNGIVSLNLDEMAATTPAPVSVSLVLDDIHLNWTFHQEKQMFQHLQAGVSSDYSEITFQAKGLNGFLALNDQKQLKQFNLNMRDFSGLPQSWTKYMTSVGRLKIDIRAAEDKAWQWRMELQADDGVLSVPEAHIQVPLSALFAAGNLSLKAGEAVALKQFEATSVQWEDGDNYGDFALKWQNDILHIAAHDGSTAMPMLWSWLWMLSDDESWQQWLLSMKQGTVDRVKATLDLDWHDPLHTTPTEKNIDTMIYEVNAYVSGADIALGLENDFLYEVDASVYLNQEGLKADVSSAVLNNKLGTIHGEYGIVWNTLMMDIQAQGVVDAGRTHMWLSPESAEELQWGKAQANADVRMKWDVDKDVPETAVAYIKPIHAPWKLKPKGIALEADKGLVKWDINKGLTIKNMGVQSPWFAGELSMALDGNADWALVDFKLAGEGELSNLTESFALPITNPQGTTEFNVDYKQKTWSGHLDFSESDWSSFAGYDKPASEQLRISFSGKPTSSSLLPITIDDLRSTQDGFVFQATAGIDENKLDLQIKDIYTAAIEGDLRVLVPFDGRLSWGLEAKTARLDKALMAAYLQPKKKELGYTSRPLNAFVATEILTWDKISATGVNFQYSSDKKGSGEFSAVSATAGDANLKNVLGSFTVLEQGKIDVHNLEADGSGQHVVISGSAIPLESGVLAWNGLALVQGEFGTLMKQAELNKLFQNGKMTSLFVGKGEFKEGEKWWRGLQGNFRLRVDDGRIIEGGTLTHLLAAISLIDLPKYLVFKRSDVVGKGLLYDKLQVEGTFNAELLDIHRLGLHSSALDAGGKGTVNLKSGEMDILLVARPWQNVEAIVSYIPVLGYILTGEDKSFLRKVYRIHGPASDAAVDELDPKDAGLPRSGLLETLISLPSQWFGD